MKWYAYMTDNNDTDWGTGSFNLEEVIEKVKNNRDVYPDAYIAVIENDVCIEEIKDI